MKRALPHFLLAFVNLLFFIVFPTFWWNAMVFGFCLAMGVASVMER